MMFSGFMPRAHEVITCKVCLLLGVSCCIMFTFCFQVTFGVAKVAFTDLRLDNVSEHLRSRSKYIILCLI